MILKPLVKKIRSLLLAALIVVSVVTIILLRYNAVIELGEFNRSSTLPVKLGARWRGGDEHGLILSQNETFGEVIYRNEGGTLLVGASGVPDVTSPSRITSLAVSGTDFSILGIKVGCKGARDILKAEGYSVKSTATGLIGVKGRITVRVITDEGVVVSVTATLESSNIMGVQF